MFILSKCHKNPSHSLAPPPQLFFTLCTPCFSYCKRQKLGRRPGNEATRILSYMYFLLKCRLSIYLNYIISCCSHPFPSQLPHFKLLSVRVPYSLPKTRPPVGSRAEECGDQLVGVETHSCIFCQSTLIGRPRINSSFLVLDTELPQN